MLLVVLFIPLYFLFSCYFLFSNLAKDCIQIRETTESLPLHITFEEVSSEKVNAYLKHSEFDDYFRGTNQTNEGEREFVREQLIQNNFENGYLTDHLWQIQLIFYGPEFLILSLETFIVVFFKHRLLKPSHLNHSVRLPF